jgi:hypothetical protein
VHMPKYRDFVVQTFMDSMLQAVAPRCFNLDTFRR